MKRTPIKRNATRMQRAWLRSYHSGEFVLFIQERPCCRCGQVPCELHHEPPRSRGGTWKDVVPLCRDCHTAGPHARHSVGQHTFWRFADGGYKGWTRRTHEAWLREEGS